MWRGWAITVMLALLVSIPAFAQRRGGAGFASRPGMSFRGTAVTRGPGFPGHANRFSTVPRSHFGVTFRAGRFPHYYRHHHRYFPYCPSGYGFCNTYGYGAYGYLGYGYPSYGYPYSGYGYTAYSDSSYDQNSDPSQQYLLQQNQELQNQLGELSQQVAELRGQQEALLRPPAAATPPTPPRADVPPNTTRPVPTEPTTLVYSDGHTEQVNNYAITGKTLWIFTEQRARRVPLSSVDVESTRRANEDRGVDFAVPNQP
jgi:hypothetical protein